MITFIFAIIIFAEITLFYSMSKVKKTQGDFRKRATESQVEEEREIYNTFIKKYDVVKRVLVGCIIIIPIISFFIIKILLP